MDNSKKLLMKFEIIKQIMDTMYNSGGFVDKETVNELLEHELEDLKKMLREVKISGVLDEDKKRN